MGQILRGSATTTEATRRAIQNSQESLRTLPVLMMGACARVGGTLSATLGERRGIGVGLVLIAVACAARALAGVFLHRHWRVHAGARMVLAALQ